MKFMFNENKKGLVYVDLQEYEKLEKQKINFDLRQYEERKNLKNW